MLQKSQKKFGKESNHGRPKLVVVLGSTASGKSSLATLLARRYNGEVVSADSRQVYKGFTITSGKTTKREMRGIRHHLLDVANPRQTFTVARYQRLARNTIRNILKRGKFPILCGGTGLYIQSIVDGTIIPEVRPNIALRKKLEKKPTQELFRMLRHKDPRRAATIDPHNPRRLIRALEIIEKLGKVPAPSGKPFQGDVLLIGIIKNKVELKKLIHARLLKRMRKGMITEVKRLHNPSAGGGLSWKRLESFGLEYRFVSRHLQGKLTANAMQKELIRAIGQYAKRQMTWFRRDKRIHWVRSPLKAIHLAGKFLKI